MNGPKVYESRDVIRLVGISPLYLNQLIERKLFGIRPSLRAGESRGSRRWFSGEDVWGVALVWWLFEAGLRSGSGRARKSVVQDVLNQICRVKRGGTASRAAAILSDPGEPTNMLVIVRQPATRSQAPSQAVSLVSDELELAELLKRNRYGVVILVPVGNLFQDLENEMIVATRR